jgi:hypothetical protein
MGKIMSIIDFVNTFEEWFYYGILLGTRIKNFEYFIK